tara:strand:+ start:129 stop:272 length:144 start_codon:yes stop_codon:yes gene_type:complete
MLFLWEKLKIQKNLNNSRGPRAALLILASAALVKKTAFLVSFRRGQS